VFNDKSHTSVAVHLRCGWITVVIIALKEF